MTDLKTPMVTHSLAWSLNCRLVAVARKEVAGWKLVAKCLAHRSSQRSKALAVAMLHAVEQSRQSAE
jgi:predicted alpha/beta hydrolase family esterase